MLRTTLAILAFALLVAGCGSGGKTIPDSKLSALVLRQRDLPPGFAVFDQGRLVRLDDQGTTRSDPGRFDREGGWKARYRRTGSTSTPGPLVVESRADVFRSVGDAKKDLALYNADFGRALATGSGRRLTPPAVGDAAIAMTLAQPGMRPLRLFRIAWRERNATASVLAQGYDGKLALADARRLARRQDALMRNAAR